MKNLLEEEDLGVFGILKPLKIDTIWLVSCRAAFGESGSSFCQTLAKVTGTEVIAADGQQIVTVWQGIELVASNGYIDDFEGTVYELTQGKGMARGLTPKRTIGANIPMIRVLFPGCDVSVGSPDLSARVMDLDLQ